MPDRFAKLAALDPDEVITHSFVRDIPISGGKTLALITLDNGKDHTRPNTLGPKALNTSAELSGLASPRSLSPTPAKATVATLTIA